MTSNVVPSETPYEWAASKLLTDLNALGAKSAIEVRRWFAQQVILSAQNRHILTQLEAPESLIRMAQRGGSSPEHSAVAARLLYQFMNRPDLILTSIPQLHDPKSWNSGSQMTTLILWAFQPWMSFRYDPKAETVFSVLENGQWIGYLKGKDSDNYLIVQIQNYLIELEKIGFAAIATALAEQGFISFTPPQGMEPSLFATALQSCEVHFNKFLSRASSVKEVVEQIQRMPIMYFNTGTLNTVQGLLPVGNGAVPTQDIYDDGPDATIMIHPAGRLIQADPEYLLYSSAGLVWPSDPQFETFVSFREQIHKGETSNSWSEWIDGAKQYQDYILRRFCPTYLSFLDHAFPTPENEAPSERDAFLRLLGAAVFGTNMKLVAAMIGAPNAGKDTVIKWMRGFLGEQVASITRAALTENGDEHRLFAPLKGARLAVVTGEVGEGRSNALLAEKIKSITSGGGLLTVAEKYEKPTTIFFDGMLILQGNSVPTITGGDKALYQNRLVAVEFKHPFPNEAPNFDEAYRKEAPHFLQVLFLSFLDYQERGGGMVGVDPPRSWKAFGEEVQRSADQLSVIDRCLTGPDRNIEIPSVVFYKALTILSRRTLGISYDISSQRWAKRLRSAGVDLSQSGNGVWRSRVNRADYAGVVMHFTLDAENSDGFFTQHDWESALQDAHVQVNS